MGKGVPQGEQRGHREREGVPEMEGSLEKRGGKELKEHLQPSPLGLRPRALRPGNCPREGSRWKDKQYISCAPFAAARRKGTYSIKSREQPNLPVKMHLEK